MSTIAEDLRIAMTAWEKMRGQEQPARPAQQAKGSKVPHPVGLVQEQASSKHEVAMGEIEELIESFINGNISTVMDQIGKMTPHGAALTGARMFEALKDPSFMRALENRAF